MNCACWAIAKAPGPTMWVTATKDELRDFLRDRLTPTFSTGRGLSGTRAAYSP
ncbi:MAG: phage terminase large subunit family protein [Verrucomicrobia bacterium]|nr:phage terminase large subunit family protein [Verrucomicrobiota bacterium]